MRILRGLTLLTIALFLSSSALVSAQNYPTRPITLVSPYGPGGAADLAARTIAGTASTYLEQSILVVNRTGAAGVTGSTTVAKGRADGYTLLLARVGSQAAVPAINTTIPYAWDEFTFLGLTELNPFVVVVSADSPYETFEDFVEAAKGGESFSYSSAGVGTLLHMGMVVLFDELGVSQDDMKHVPFDGGGAAAAAVVGGQVDMMFQNLSGVIGNIESGTMRALVVSTPDRFDAIPDVPTASEVGYPGLEAVVGWSGVWGPPDLPEEVVDTWVDVLASLNEDRAWLRLTTSLGSVPQILNPEDTAIFVENQYETFSELAERLDMKIE